MFQISRYPKRWTALAVLSLLAFALGLAGCGGEAPAPEAKTEAPAEVWPPALPGYAAMTIPADNPMSKDKVELGKMLYYDKRVSGDGNRSCYGCHLKEHGLATGDALAIGAFDKTLTRNVPTMWNTGYLDKWYWDGRATALEAQVKGAWSGGNMGASGKDGAPSMEDICAKLNEIPGYSEKFQAVFGGPATPDNVAQAVASFMRTIVATDSPWTRFRNGDESALSEEAKKGYDLFANKAKCTNCHDGLLMTDMQFHNVGIGCEGSTCKDIGRANVGDKDPAMTGAFKTPTLLDVSKSGPYFHDGSVASLEDAVHLMSSGGQPNQWLDEKNLADAKNANLTPEEEAAIVAFLKEITANYTITEPMLP
ncbi:MAG: cytochrome c peroxidase [Bryobacterales bacterium]